MRPNPTYLAWKRHTDRSPGLDLLLVLRPHSHHHPHRAVGPISPTPRAGAASRNAISVRRLSFVVSTRLRPCRRGSWGASPGSTGSRRQGRGRHVLPGSARVTLKGAPLSNERRTLDSGSLQQRGQPCFRTCCVEREEPDRLSTSASTLTKDWKRKAQYRWGMRVCGPLP